MLWDGIARRAFGLGDGGGGEGVTQIAAEREPRSKLKIGLALGGGAARGWSHIGVMRVLQREGIVPDVIAGSSVGAVVAGCYAADKLDQLEEFAVSLTKRRVMGLLDFHITGSGLIAGDRLRRLLEHDLADLRIENLPLRFATIATELGTGHEIWITRGPLVEALRASYALPGVFDPVRLGGRWLMDGAIVNPIPVTTARALGADLVVCVNLNGDIRIRGTVIQSHSAEIEESDEIIEAATEERRRWSVLNPMLGSRSRRSMAAPGIASVMVDAFNITQDRIARSRLAGDPPDIMISPKLSPVGLFEFHRAEECIELGKQATERVLPDPFEMMPHSRPFSTTGMWRNLRCVISSMSSLMVVWRVQVTTLPVMCCDTGCSSAAAPPRATARTMSRSDRMPSTASSGPPTMTAPILFSVSARAASANVRLGSIVRTSRPFAMRMCSTFIAFLRWSRRRGGAAY